MAEALWAELQAQFDAAFQRVEAEKAERLARRDAELDEKHRMLHEIDTMLAEFHAKRDALAQQIAHANQQFSDLPLYDAILNRMMPMKRPITEVFASPPLSAHPPPFSLEHVCATHAFSAINFHDSVVPVLIPNLQLYNVYDFRRVTSFDELINVLLTGVLPVHLEIGAETEDPVEYLCYVAWTSCGNGACYFCHGSAGPSQPPVLYSTHTERLQSISLTK